MALIAMASASGAPGVTASALALTLLWPRPALLVEASPEGSSAVLSGYLRGAVAPEGRSVLGLVRAQRQGRLREALEENAVALDGEQRHRLVPAISHPDQAASLGRLWEPLAAVLREAGQCDPDGTEGSERAASNSPVDVIVDAGRLGAACGPEPLLRAADLVLLCLRTQLPAVAAARTRADSLRRLLGAESVSTLRSSADDVQGGAPASGPDRRLGLLIIGDGRPYTGREIADVVGAPVMGTLAWDPSAAEVLSVGSPRSRRWEASAYIRSAAGTVEAVQRDLATGGGASGGAPAQGLSELPLQTTRAGAAR